MTDNSRSRTWLWIIIGGGAFFLFVLAVFTLVYVTLHAGGERGTLASFGDKIGVVDLEGVIIDPSTVVQQLKKFGDDDSIKAIILHVNSPGGGVAASEEIYREVKRIRDEKVSAAELENAKHAIVGSFALNLESPQQLLNNIITQKLYNLPANYWDTYPQKVEAITMDDVQRVAQKYIDINHMQIVAVGDASKTREVLAKFGSVTEYDADGKPMRTASATGQ